MYAVPRGRTSGDLPLALDLAGRLPPAALEEGAVLVTEPGRAVGADAVRELHAPPAPGRHALDERVTVIARMPRAATEEHRTLLTLSPALCNGYAPPAWRYADAHFSVIEWLETEKLSTLSRAPVEKILTRPAVAAAVTRRHNRP